MTTYQQKAVFTKRDLTSYYGQPFISMPRICDSVSTLCLIMLLYFIAEPYLLFMLLHALTVLNLGGGEYVLHS